MLYEITRTRQVAGEPRRRWFFSDDQDLLVWVGEDGAPVAFQLAYDKYRKERALRWKTGHGFSHYIVDDGEARDGISNDAPILLEGGAFPALQVVRRFIELSAEMPREVAGFIRARLREHPEFREELSRSRRSDVAAGLAIGLAIVVAGIALSNMRSR